MLILIILLSLNVQAPFQELALLQELLIAHCAIVQVDLLDEHYK